MGSAEVISLLLESLGSPCEPHARRSEERVQRPLRRIRVIGESPVSRALTIESPTARRTAPAAPDLSTRNGVAPVFF